MYPRLFFVCAHVLKWIEVSITREYKKGGYQVAKSSYQLRTPLTKTWADVEVPLTNSDGFGFKKPIAVGTLLIYLLALMMGFCIVSMSDVFKRAGLLCQIAFFIIWCLLVWLLMRTDDTNTHQYSYLPVMLGYYPRDKREVIVRKTTPASVFQSVTGIRKIGDNASVDDATGSTYDDALLVFTNGYLGYLYSVTGNASLLLFDSDRDMILDRVRIWENTRPVECEEITITVKSAQSVLHQIGEVQRRANDLAALGLCEDPDMQAMLRQEYTLLEGDVGKLHRSIHQFYVLIAPNYEQLQQAQNTFYGEVNTSSLVYKSVSKYHGEAIGPVLAKIYKAHVDM